MGSSHKDVWSATQGGGFNADLLCDVRCKRIGGGLITFDGTTHELLVWSRIFFEWENDADQPAKGRQHVISVLSQYYLSTSPVLD